MAASPCSAGLLRFLALTFFLITLWIFIHSYTSFSIKNIRLPRWLGECSSLLETRPMDQAYSSLHPWLTQETWQGIGLLLGP